MAYRQIWEIEVSHNGLNKYRHIRGTDRAIVEQKAATQRAVWKEMWQKKQEVEQRQQSKRQAILNKEQKKDLAIIKTEEALSAIEYLENILSHTLAVDDTIVWENLIDKSKFPEPKPVIKNYSAIMPMPPQLVDLPAEPYSNSHRYKPKISFFDLFSTNRKRKRMQLALQLFEKDFTDWLQEKSRIEQLNTELDAEHQAAISLWHADKSQHDNQQLVNVDDWRQKKHIFSEQQASANALLLNKKELYLNKDTDAVYDYCEMVLANSQYPDYFPQEWELDYIPETGVLVVDYSLPNIELLPKIKAVKYVATKDEFTDSYLSGAEINRLYDSLLYQITLRTIHELYEADLAKALTSIVFNGWVDSVDKATGHNVNSCIMSLQASKDEFLAINLEKVDPKECFRQLKGVGSSKLHGLSAVAPILKISKEDRRFVTAYDVADNVNESDNLAVMDWQDFENLVREVFEKEFTSTGGEVKITQASRDGGVDAIAFDPDPIRGGKIVIQAKRYSAAVGVSAVRDLYGTTLNEGAIKGILVTTANFGPDAYEFAKGKPLTLLNGSNLLHLLEKHGHRARIDLKEAKQFLSEKKA